VKKMKKTAGLGTAIKLQTPMELKNMSKKVFGKPSVGGKALPKGMCNTKNLW
jgi:hypothetical protein